MSERCPGFSGFERQPDPASTLVEGMRQAAFEMLDHAEDALSREIAEKLLLKADIKDRVAAMVAYADDVAVRQDLKQLGTLVVRETEAQFDYDDPKSGFNIQRGDRYLELHVPPVPEESRNSTAAHRSLELVRQYILAHDLDPKYLMGVSHERLGEIAKKFGFGVARPDPATLPENVIRGVQRVYQEFTDDGLNGMDMGMPVIIFRRTAEFLEDGHKSDPQRQP